MGRLFTVILTPVMIGLLAGCGGQQAATPSEAADAPARAGRDAVSAESRSEPALTQPTADTASDRARPAESALSGEEFIAQAESLAGKTITLGRCSLMTEPSAEGDLACRVTDDLDMDLMDPDGLPVDVFFKESELSPEASAWLADNCADMFCMVQITGQLSVSPDTFFLELSDVSLAEASQLQ